MGRSITDAEAETPLEPRVGPSADFERLDRAEVDAVTGFFARRSADPETVADLTAETFMEAMRSSRS